jgi:hypothetical protein
MLLQFILVETIHAPSCRRTNLLLGWNIMGNWEWQYIQPSTPVLVSTLAKPMNRFRWNHTAPLFLADKSTAGVPTVPAMGWNHNITTNYSCTCIQYIKCYCNCAGGNQTCPLLQTDKSTAGVPTLTANWSWKYNTKQKFAELVSRITNAIAIAAVESYMRHCFCGQTNCWGAKFPANWRLNHSNNNTP